MSDSFQPDSFQPDSFQPDSFAPEGKPTYDKGFFKVYKGGAKTLPQRLDTAAGSASDVVLNMLKLPYDLVGEAVTAPIEQRGFRAPSLFGGENPADPIATINKLLRAGAAGVATGNMDTARAAYNAPRGVMGPIEDTAMALLLGKVAPEVLTAPADVMAAATEKTLSSAKSLASGVVKKGIRTALGPTEEAQKVLFNRPQDVARQTNFNDLGDKLAQTANDLGQKVDQLDNQAWDTLLKLKAEPQSRLIQILQNVKKTFIGKGGAKISDSDKQAVAQIDKYIERVQQISGDKYNAANPATEKFLDQEQLKELVQSIRRDATYGLVKNEPVNRAVKAAGHGIDQYLKGENPNYAEAMKPVQEATAALEDTIKRFQLQKHPTNPELGYVPTTTTLSKLKNLAAEKNPEVTRAVEQLKNATGVDFKDEASLTAVKQVFEKGMRANGSRRVQMGKGTGAAVGFGLAKLLGIPPWGPAVAGGAVGGELGGATDIYGGPMAAKVIDTLRKTNSGVGKVLSAINNKAAGTPLEDVVRKLIAGEPALADLLKGNQ